MKDRILGMYLKTLWYRFELEEKIIFRGYIRSYFSENIANRIIEKLNNDVY